MKKFLAVFSLLMLVLLTGCLSDKTERDLNATPDSTSESTYQQKTTVTTPQTTYQGSYVEFKYPTDTTNLKDASTTGIVSGAETVTIENKTDKVNLITITSYENKTVTNDAEIKALVNGKISSTAVVTETAKGTIGFNISGQGTYSLGTVVDGTTTYYYYVAQVTKNLIKTGSTEATNFTYVVRTILKTNTNSDLRNFEDIVRSLSSKEKVEEGTNPKLVEEIALLNSIKSFESVSLSNSTNRTKAESAIESLYKYVEGNTRYVPSSIAGQELRRSAAMQFINTWVINGDGTIGEKTKTLLERLETAYRDELKAAVATAQGQLSQENLKVFKISNVGELESVLGKLIDKRVQQEVIVGYDFGEKINNDIAIQNLRLKYDVFSTAVNLIVNYYVEYIRVDWLGRDSIPHKVFQAVNYTLPTMEKAIDYQSYLEIDLNEINYMKSGGLTEISAREYVRKEAVESLKSSTSKIGYDKITLTDYSTTQSLVGIVFTDAVNLVKAERITNLNEENRDFFIKANTQATISQVNTNELVNCKNKIELALYNLVKFVKMFDSNVNLTASSYKDLDTIKSDITSGTLAAYQGVNPLPEYITLTKDNYATIVLEWNNYKVHAADTILKYFSSYELDNNN